MDTTPTIALIGALLLLLVPGGVLAHVLGFRGLWWLALAPVISVASVSVTGVVAAPLRLPFQWWEPVALAVVAAAIVVAIRAARRRRLLRPQVGRWSRGSVVAVIAVGFAAMAAGLVTGAGIGTWDHISQTYDGLFHLNAVAWIQSTGDASSFDLYRITHPGTGNEFYPAAWHALVFSTVQAAGASVPVATNATWIAVQSLVWTPGIALLGAVVAPARLRSLAAVLTAIASVGLIGFPDLLLAWGTLYPTALAYALLPVGLVLTLRVLRWIVTVPRDGRLPFPGRIVALLTIWLVASALAHPRSLFGWVVLAAPIVVLEGARAVRAIWSRPLWRRRLLATVLVIVAAILGVVAVGAVYVYWTFDLAHRPISDHLNGGPATATQGLPASLAQVLALAPPSPSGAGILPASWVLAVLVVVGVVVALPRIRTRWIAIAWALAIVFYVLAAGSNSDIAKVLTGVWYKDKFRLFALLPIVQAPLVALVGVELVSRLRSRARLVGTAVVSVLIGVGSVSSNAVTAAPAMIGAVFALPAHDKAGKLLDGDEQRLLAELPRYVPAGDVVAGDPWDGSSLSWAIGHRRALFPHLAGEWSPDQLLVANGIDRLTTDPAVCAAVHRLDLRWIVEDPQLLWGSPPDAAPFAGFHRAVQAGVLLPVAHVGSAGLYRIPACDG